MSETAEIWSAIIAGLVALVGTVWQIASMDRRIKDLEETTDKHDKLIEELIASGNSRHIENIKEFGKTRETMAGLPDAIVQRIEKLIRERERERE